MEFHENLLDVRQQAHPAINGFAAEIAAGLHKRIEPGFVFFEIFAQLNDALEPKPNLRQQRARLGAGVMLFKSMRHELTRGYFAVFSFFLTVSFASSETDFCHASRALSV